MRHTSRKLPPPLSVAAVCLFPALTVPPQGVAMCLCNDPLDPSALALHLVGLATGWQPPQRVARGALRWWHR
ncbi:MAG: hypothetical protein H0T73_20225 [Ardenticatenales bacterium]|nr:hypothetical protein [Ardenticatenales bacterium]